MNKEGKQLTKDDFPVLWQGCLKMKSFLAGVRMHYIAGTTEIAMKSLPSHKDKSTPMKIGQRMEIEPTKMEDVIKKIKKLDEHCMLIAFPLGLGQEDFLRQCSIIKDNFITYLESKRAAGIINSAREGISEPSYVMHFFPPSDFTYSLLKKLPEKMLKALHGVAHLMVIITTV